MLRPAGDGEKSFGELAQQLVDDAKAYAHAELDLARAMLAERARSFWISAALFGAAVLVAIGAMSALCVAIFVALATLIGPLLAGITTFLIVGAIAAGLGWLGWQKLKDAL